MSRFSVAALLIGVFLLTPSQPVRAQVVYGSIFGTVTDPSGAPVPNAKVIITNTATGTRTEAVTNEDGNYSRGQLIAGPYRVEVETAGFRRSIVQDVTVSVDVAGRVDVKLEIGEVTQQVEVVAEAPLLRQDRAEVATQFTTKQLVELPSFDRNFQAYQLLVPGSQRVSWQHAPSENPQGSVQIQMNGQHFSFTDYQLDGTSNQDPILGIIVINPTIDSVIESKIATQNYDAEFALAAAGVSVITTKSGTNEFHGSLFEFNRTNTPGFTTFARNPFNASENNGTPTTRWNQFGGSIGGPAVRNKLFFFGDAQITRRTTGSSVLLTIPTARARTGDLSEYLEPLAGGATVQTVSGATVPLQRNMIFDPTTGDPTTGIGRRAFDNNIIPASRLSAQARALLQYLPMPNTRDAGGSPFRRNFSTQGQEKFDSEQWNTRGDWFINDSSSLFARYSNAAYRRNSPAAFGELAGGQGLDAPVDEIAGLSESTNRSLAIGYNKTFSPSLIGEFRFGFMRYGVDVLPHGVGASPARDAGIPGLNVDDFFTSGMPAFFIEGDAETEFGYALGINRCNCPLEQREKQYQGVANITKVLGNHNMKFGVDLRYALNLRVPSDRHRSGQLRFRSGTTGWVPTGGGGVQQGLGLGTFLLGQVSQFDRYVGRSTDAAERQKRFFFFGQDMWRVTPKLQVNYGLRWEMIFPETVNEAGNGAQPDLTTGEMAVFGIGDVSMHGLQEMKWGNIAPRIGVTYQLTPRTVVRAGYGWSYALGTFGSIFGHNVTQNFPILAVQEINPTNDFSSVFTLVQGPPAPVFTEPNQQTGRLRLPDGINVRSRPENLRMPRVMAHNLTVQHQLFRDMAIEVGYVGNVGRHVFVGEGPDVNINEPAFIPGSTLNQNQRRPFFQQFGWTQGISHYCNCATNKYNSLQLRLDKRFSGGLGFQLNYTYQDAEGDHDSWSFLYNRELNRGNKEWITHHVFQAPVNWDIPFGRGRRWSIDNGIADALLGGWSLNAITYITSGRPFTPRIGDFPAGAIRPDVGPRDRPDQGTEDPYEGARGNRDQWYKGGLGGAFLVPANNEFGDYPLRTLYSPSLWNQDLALHKNFQFTERFRLQLRGEAFNVFNHTNLGDPNDNVTSPEAGRITSLAPGQLMRRLQLAARIDF
jgi:hypothetical protein